MSALSDIPEAEQHAFLDLAKTFQFEKLWPLVTEKPALVNAQPKQRWSALHQAARSKAIEPVKFLLHFGASLDAKTTDGKTPLDILDSEARNNAELVELLTPVEPNKKRAKTDKPIYNFNMNYFLVKDAEALPLRTIADMPVDVLQGLAKLGKEALNPRGVHTVRDLANWKYYKIARAIVACIEAQQDCRRDPLAEMNINRALDKQWETSTLPEMAVAPVSALQGLTEDDDARFAKLHIKSIEKLGRWKFPRWAEAICDLCAFENEDHSSR